MSYTSRNKGIMAAMATISLAMMDYSQTNKRKSTSKSKKLTEEEIAELNFINSNKINLIKEQNGLKEFQFKEGKIWALNQKSANKKAKKQGWI